MNEEKIFEKIDWTAIEKIAIPGDIGISYHQSIEFPGFCLRQVEYSVNYKSDHWCNKGHIVHCISGESEIEFQSGEKVILVKGMSLFIFSEKKMHRLISQNGAKVIIIDGNFLEQKNI
jgi:hypothetical protein